MEVMTFIEKGQLVDLSESQFYQLFRILTLSLNEIAAGTLNVSTDFQFDYKFDMPSPE